MELSGPTVSYLPHFWPPNNQPSKEMGIENYDLIGNQFPVIEVPGQTGSCQVLTNLL